MRAMLGLLVTVLALVAGVGRAASANTVRMTVLNEADTELAVYWVNTWSNGKLVRQKEEAIVSSGSLNIDSFFGHSFLIVEEQHVEGLTAYDAKMWNPKIMAFFTMGEFDLEARISRDDRGELKVELESALTRTAKIMATAAEKCRSSPAVLKASARLRGIASAQGSCLTSATEDPNETSPEFAECLTKAVAGDLAKKEREANKSMKMLEMVGDRARNYTCVDPLMETTNTSLAELNWLDPASGATHRAQLFLDEPDAKVLLLDDFVSDAECKALQDHASPHLKAATVSVGIGKSALSQARRAKAGGVSADLDNPKSITANLYRRGYAFANNVTGYDLPLPGQEGFSVIKYGPDDEYRPHCDGDCTGAEFLSGGRVATMVIYCEQAKTGGGTTFSSSDVFINGKKGQAVFFSYLGPDNRTDKGRTRHSGCPIVKGTKWIATLWMRRGVTVEKDWRHYDPSGTPSEFALELARKASKDSATHAAGVETQKSGVGGSESKATTTAAAATTAAVQRQVEGEASVEEGAGVGVGVGGDGGGGGGAQKDRMLSGITGSISSMFSK